MIDLWLPPKPAIIIPAREIKKPVSFKPAWLPGIVMPQVIGAAVTPASLSFIAATQDASALTTYTYASQSIGVADSTRRVLVIVHWENGPAARTISSATIAGVAATIHVNVSGVRSCGIISAKVPTGTTGTIAITFSGACQATGIGVYRMINESVASPNATASDTVSAFSVSINVPTSGVLLAGGTVQGNAAVATFIWTGATEDYDRDIDGGLNSSTAGISGASATGLSLQTGRTVSFTQSDGTVGTLAVLTWG